jgi:hypothetical protein
MNNLIRFGVLAAFFGTIGCGPTLMPFTQKLYEENRWSDAELKNIQFYVSRDIILWREATEGSSKIAQGKIKVVKGRRVEELRIRRGTPGVFIFSPKDNRFAVSFESDSDQRYLMFGPNPKRQNTYVLLASDWKGTTGSITYDNTTYYTDANSGMAALLVDLDRNVRTSYKSRVAKGRTIE